MSIDFSKVDVAEGKSYVRPGYYVLAPTKVVLVEEGVKTPYIAITFSGESGEMTDKFYLTESAFPKIQYLHNAYFGKKIDKAFTDFKQLTAYMEKVLTTKTLSRMMCVAGSQGSNGKIYTNLPWSNFIIPETMKVEEGAFKEDSFEYRQNVKLTSITNPSTESDSTILPDSAPEVKKREEFLDDLPF